jgi:polyphosphate kinase
MNTTQDIEKVPLVNREISWLHFNERVLQEAADTTVPLIERLRFLAIFSSNLDEFYRVRVATLTRLSDVNVQAKEMLGFSPKKVLKQIKEQVVDLERRFDKLYEEIIQQLADEKIYIINEKQLNVSRGQFVRTYFIDEVLPKLVPVMLDSGRISKPFPELKDRRIYFLIRLTQKKKVSYALLEVPTNVFSRFLILPPERNLNFIILLDDIIRYCFTELFYIFNYTRIEGYTIQLTRDAELDLDQNVSEKFIDVLASSLKKREKGKPMRLLYDAEMPRDMLDYLRKKMKLSSEFFIPGNRYHNFKDFIKFPNVGSSKLEFRPLNPLPVAGFDLKRSLFSQMKKSDYLVSLPYQSYDYIIHFLREAAIDPKVVTIAISLYRLAEQSSVVNALINAVANGKEVHCFLEIKARFDEQANIDWSQKLTEAGANVYLSRADVKVHAKICLVGRKEKKGIRHFAILATGNYNEKTAQIYCDHSLFTVNRNIVNDLTKLFTDLARNTFSDGYQAIITSPLETRPRLMEMIDREIEHASAGRPASLIFKMNSLTDEALIRKMYEASNAGVRIDLIVRGICSLVPQVAGVSENIYLRSIVDRYLEHARVWIFHNGGEEEIYLSSADFMNRNLDKRVEVSFPIYDPGIKEQIRHIIHLQLNDTTKARTVNMPEKNQYITTNSLSRGHHAQLETYIYFRNQLSP